MLCVMPFFYLYIYLFSNKIGTVKVCESLGTVAGQVTVGSLTGNTNIHTE